MDVRGQRKNCAVVLVGTITLLLAGGAAADRFVSGRVTGFSSSFGGSVLSRCGKGEFYKLSTRTCMKCDRRCARNSCILNSGCTRCQNGFYSSREDMPWPLECLRCDVENCSKCKDNVFHADGAVCTTCKKGYTLDTDKNKCVPKGMAEDISTVGKKEPEDKKPEDKKPEDKKPEVEKVPEEKMEKGKYPKSEGCEAGYILKQHDMSCKKCDVNCPAHHCVDFEGCTDCNDGYYRSRVDDFWPYECKLCVEQVPNCKTCRGGHQVYHQLGTVCLECKAGHTLANEGRMCVPIHG